jgi:predicted PolB exonuclease-like 3'-5' exonuclease
MIVALDIETIGNPEAVALMPEPEVKAGNVKDPAKIAAKQAEAKAAQLEKAALDPLTARIICYAAVGMVGADETHHVSIVAAATDTAERGIIQEIMETLGSPEMRIVTWNGIGFDLPMIYKRAMILGVDPGNFGAPPLSAWTKRYSTDRHYDLMQIWGGWSSMGFAKLDTVAGLVLKERKTAGIDVTTFPAVMQTEEGRKSIADYCLQDTHLTWRLWKRFNGVLFQ